MLHSLKIVNDAKRGVRSCCGHMPWKKPSLVFVVISAAATVLAKGFHLAIPAHFISSKL